MPMMILDQVMLYILDKLRGERRIMLLSLAAITVFYIAYHFVNRSIVNTKSFMSSADDVKHC